MLKIKKSIVWFLVIAASFILLDHNWAPNNPIKVLSVIFSFIVLGLCLYLLNISCEILNPKRISLQTFFIVGYITMLYVPSIVFVSKLPYNLEYFKENNYKFIFVAAIVGGLFAYTLGVVFANRYFKFIVFEQRRFFDAPIDYLNNEPKMFVIATAIGIFCIALTIAYFFYLPVAWSELPLFYMFAHPGDSNELALLREKVFKLLDPRWSDSPFSFTFYFYLALRMWLYPFLVVFIFIYYISTRNSKWLYLLIICGGVAAFYAASSIARAPLAAIIMRFCFAWYFYRRCNLNMRQGAIILLAVVSFPLLVTFLAQSNQGIVSTLRLLSERLFVTPTKDLLIYFEAFPLYFDYQHGHVLIKSIVKLFGYNHFYIEGAIYNFQFPYSNVPSGHANAAYLSNLYADFGFFGCIIGSFIIGVFVQFTHIHIVRKEKTPLNVTLYCYLIYAWWILTFGSITSVLGTNGVIFALLMPYVVKLASKILDILILRKKNLDALDKYHKN
jgi:hypothetical protein